MDYFIDVLTLIAVMAIAIHGYMLIKGLGGLMHLGHPVFYGVGAYTSAILSTAVLPQGSFAISLIAATVVSMIVAAILGVPALRERGRYFMILTFAIHLIFVSLVINLGFTGGPDGIANIPRMSIGPYQLESDTVWPLGAVTLSLPAITLIVISLFALGSYLLCSRIVHSPFGRNVRAARDDELAVEAHGRRPERLKLSIFIIGSGVTGAAGGLFAHYFNYVGPFQFEMDIVVLFLMMLILGGQGNLLGATIGAALAIGILEGLRFFFEDVVDVPFQATAHIREIFFSVMLIAILFLKPDGLIKEKFVFFRRADPRPATSREEEQESVAAAAAPVELQESRVERSKSTEELPTRSIIRVEGISKSFGGLIAVDRCTLSLRDREIVTIIGPNGAGKTTVFNMISGFEKPDEGRIFLGDEDITHLHPADISTKGVVRTFQDVRIWPRLTVMENILATAPNQVGENPLKLFSHAGLVRIQEAENVERAWELLDRFDLAHTANQLAGELSYAQKKLVSMARLLSFRPRTILLDEPTAGVDPRRLDLFLGHIRSFVDREQCSMCLIEHNMEVVRELSDWVVFMEEGKVMAQGTAGDVLGNRGLMSLYLGQDMAVVA